MPRSHTPKRIIINPLKKSTTVQTENLKMAGMSCGSYTSKVTNALQAVTGVSEINVARGWRSHCAIQRAPSFASRR